MRYSIVKMYEQMFVKSFCDLHFVYKICLKSVTFKCYNIDTSREHPYKQKGFKTMTQKRFSKLCRAYFTRLNEWAKANNSTTMDMGRLYKIVETMKPANITRAEWWEMLSCGEVFGVGKKGA